MPLVVHSLHKPFNNFPRQPLAGQTRGHAPVSFDQELLQGFPQLVQLRICGERPHRRLQHPLTNNLTLPALPDPAQHLGPHLAVHALWTHDPPIDLVERGYPFWE
ncbi:hypothetical protein DACRYDRAFT_24942 [Dacryopinax primogenitus]|uniref:Uncharacterized protein n=1 Tax=Dacryopinax primogenitus (strain DJM 731) TaxID=1858805 RepID=M5FVZ6_DACPD|nr:uncharacterized protein DACRYDRAFT_24942 [Dacryopinax primogenitus]EJT97536.1 hypothetical protein DACRYDRAFT_24942 [Dacryopinax primogenitus]